MALCRRCGTSGGDEYRFCPNCGTPLGEISQDPYIGKVISGQYKVLSLLGEGGMSSVYLAEQAFIDRLVAIKLLKRGIIDFDVMSKIFLREARSISQVSHENIITIFSFDKDDAGTPFIVMEYISGVSLAEELEQSGPLSMERAARIVLQITSALGEAHRQGIIHRDLKPSNIMLLNRGNDTDSIKILDFGIAKRMESAVDNRQSTLLPRGIIAGTPTYMAPEQGRGLSVDHRADIYSLGIIFFEMLTGRVPFSGSNPTDIIIKHISAPPPSLCAIRSDLPKELEDLIGRALLKDREDRYSSMEEFALALETLTKAFPRGESVSSIGDKGKATPARNLSTMLMSVSRGDASPARVEKDSQNGTTLGLQSISPHVSFIFESEPGREQAYQLVVKYPNYINDGDAQGALDNLIKRFGGQKRDAVEDIITLSFREGDCKGNPAERAVSLALELSKRGSARSVIAKDGEFDCREETVGVLSHPGCRSGVVMTRNAFSSIRSAFSARPLEIVPLPGLYHALPLVEILHKRILGSPAQIPHIFGVETPMVGREHELDFLFTTYERVVHRREGELVSLFGAPGVGKSRLALEFICSLDNREKPPTIIYSRCREDMAMSPFSPLSNLLREIIGKETHDDGSPGDCLETFFREAFSDRRQLGRRRSDRSGQESTAYRPHGRYDEIKQFFLEASGYSKPRLTTDLSDNRYRPLEALSYLRKALARVWARSALVLVLDDADWASPSLLTLLSYMTAPLGELPLLILCLFQGNHPFLPLLEGSQSLTLPALEIESVEALATSVLKLPKRRIKLLAQALYRDVNGNPLGVEQGFWILRERGFLGSGPISTFAPLGNLEERLSLRMEALDPELADVLRKASIFPGPFEEEDLYWLNASAKGVGTIVRAVNTGILNQLPLREGRPQGYEFNNSLVRGAFRETLPQKERISLHRMVAGRLSQASQDNDGFRGEALCFHAERGGDLEIAINAFQRSGYRSCALGARNEATFRFNSIFKFMNILNSVSNRLTLQTKTIDIKTILAELALQSGDTWEANRLTADVLSYPQGKEIEQLIVLKRANLWRKNALAHEREGDYASSMDECLRAMESLKDIITVCPNSVEAMAQCFWDMGRLSFIQEKFQDAEVYYQKGVELLKSGGKGLTIARLYSALGALAWTRGQVERAFDLHERGLRMMEPMGPLRERAKASASLGVIFSGYGSSERALHFLGQAADLYDQAGDLRGEAMALTNMGLALAKGGKQDLALIKLQKAFRLFLHGRTIWEAQEVCRILAELFLASNDKNQAERWILDALRLPCDDFPPGGLYRLLAIVQDENAPWDQTRSNFSRAVEVSRGQQNILEELRTLVEWAATAVRHARDTKAPSGGLKDEAQRCLAEAKARAEAVGQKEFIERIIELESLM